MTATANFAKPFKVSVTADANGNATVYAENTDLGKQINRGAGVQRVLYGDISKVTYTPDAALPFQANANLTLTLERSGEPVAELLLGSGGPQAWYPRPTLMPEVPLSADNQENTTYLTGMVYVDGERVKIVVAGAGAGRKGTITVFVR